MPQAILLALLYYSVSSCNHIPGYASSIQSQSYFIGSLAAMATPQQVVKVKDMVKAWKKPADWDTVPRRIYPFECDPIPDPGLMEEFNIFMASIPLASNTRKKYATALTRFMMMFETLDGSPVDFPHLILNILRSELFQSLPELDIMTPEYSSSLAMSVAVAHFAEMQKLRFATEGNDLAMQMIDATIKVHLEPWRKSCIAAQACAAAQR